MIGYEGFDQRQENEQYRIHVGVVATVDAEKQTMSVNIPGVGQVPDIYINNAISLTGSGVRVMPVPSITRALIYEQKSIFYHIGTYHNAVGDDNINLGLAPYTNDSNGNKNTNDEVVLQRYVDAGEVCITGYSSAEIYLPNSGDVLIVNGSRVSMELNSALSSIIAKAVGYSYESPDVVVRYGSVIRKTSGPELADEIYYNNNSSIFSESNLPIDATATEMYEFSVDVGTPTNPSTGSYASGAEPIIGRMSLAPVVLDNSGVPILENGANLVYLVDVVRSNTRICVDLNGVYQVVDTTPGKSTRDGIFFKTGADVNYRTVIGASVLELNRFGEYSVSNGENKFFFDRNGKISLQNSNGSIIIYPDGRLEVKNDQVSLITTSTGDLSITTTQTITLSS